MAVLWVFLLQDAFVDELVELGIQALEDRHWLVMSSPHPNSKCHRCRLDDT